MTELKQLLHAVFSDRDIAPEDVPRLDLYMDQVLALFDEGLSASLRAPSDKPLTKTMVHNYSKEGLLTPVKGKKYSRQQIMQLLCIYHLKQTLLLSDVKALTGRDNVDFEACYARLLRSKEEMREKAPPALTECLPAGLDDPNERLVACLTLTALSDYLRRLCEQLIDGADA